MSMTATLRVGARGDGEPRPAGCRAGWWWTRWRRGGQSVAVASSLMAGRAEASATMVLPAVEGGGRAGEGGRVVGRGGPRARPWGARAAAPGDRGADRPARAGGRRVDPPGS